MKRKLREYAINPSAMDEIMISGRNLYVCDVCDPLAMDEALEENGFVVTFEELDDTIRNIFDIEPEDIEENIELILIEDGVFQIQSTRVANTNESEFRQYYKRGSWRF